MRLSFPIFATIALMLFYALPLRAEVVRVRSGEHPGFTRIVLEGTAQAGWSVTRGRDGYVFRAADAVTSFDISGAFDLIPRGRVADLGARDGGILDLAVPCNCHVAAFETAGGAVVIDVKDGAPPAGSPFEAPDGGGAGDQVVAAGKQVTGLALSPWQPASITPPVADPHLPVYWQKGAAPVAAFPPGSGDQRPDPTPPPAAAAFVPADSRADEIRKALAEQLGRAAAQGIITFDTPPLPDPAPEPVAASGTENRAPAVTTPQDDPGLPLHVETSVDRDSGFPEIDAALSAEGRSCPEDSAFAPADWGDETPAAYQLAERRQGLVGEFDKPDHDKVVALARLYIHLGFGAEARATLDAFVVGEADAPWLRTLAAIVDGEEKAPATLNGFTSCDGAVALWALLETREPRARNDINSAAVLGAFSALPAHLRRLLGPELMERLIAVGDADAAHAARAAVLRTGMAADPELEIASADLAKAGGDAASAEESLDTIATGGSPAASEALSRAIRLRLDRDEAVPPALAESAAALASEFRHEKKGPELAVLQILSLASTGDFGSAFSEEARWQEAFPEPLAQEVLLSLFAMLARKGDDWTLLNHYYRERDRILRFDPDVLLRLDMAERLAGAGLGAEAKALLKGEAAATGRGKLILARSALDDGDAAAALDALAGAESSEAAALRAEAYLRQNQPQKAEAELSGSGDAAGAARAAWLAGGRRSGAAAAPDGVAEALKTLAPAPAPAVASKGDEGELEAGRGLVAETGLAREALASLLRFATEVAP
ncbi:MAG TPA: hypothetical protein PLI43_02550 [Albidovulum sp.]|uniref:hypothetical protein n=1 Tax=Albidovulum sp. TaxID=1872424 RepID=UPI002BCFCFEE|nr:hypothetical protein [Albidovulum sp.]